MFLGQVPVDDTPILLIFTGYAIGIILVALGYFVPDSKKVDLYIRHEDYTGDTPLDILKKRYVKGDISKSEYEKMRKNIEK